MLQVGASWPASAKFPLHTYVTYDQQGKRVGTDNVCGVDAPRLASLDSHTVFGRPFAIAANTITNLLSLVKIDIPWDIFPFSL